MTSNQRLWAEAKRDLRAAVVSLGYPEELTDLLAGELGSPRAMDRMTAYLTRVRPTSMEMLAEEMLAIRDDADTWRAKKAAQEAQAGYSAWLNSDTRQQMEDDFFPE